jgi:hypothetical protein
LFVWFISSFSFSFKGKGRWTFDGNKHATNEFESTVFSSISKLISELLSLSSWL